MTGAVVLTLDAIVYIALFAAVAGFVAGWLALWVMAVRR